MRPTDDVLLAALPGALAVRACPYPYATSSPLTELAVDYVDGSTRRLLLKEVRSPREISVYRDVLAPAGIGAALYASGDAWLVLELVAGVELWQVGEVERWATVASWLGEHHRRFAGFTGSVPVLGVDVLAGWVERAAADVPLDATRCVEAVTALLTSTRTLIHGEFYPSNVLLAGPRVVPVDWETAALGPGVLDLAALITGWDDDAQRTLISAYGEVCDVDLDRARLALALRWIGWRPGWTPPEEHRHDWLGEALAAAERLGL